MANLQYLLAQAMARAKNSATVDQIAKCARGCLTSLGDCYGVSNETEMEQTALVYCEFVVDALDHTPRLNFRDLAAAAVQAFEVELLHAEAWAKAVCKIVQHCRALAPSTVEGKKLTPGIRKITLKVKSLGPSRSPEPTDSLDCTQGRAPAVSTPAQGTARSHEASDSSRPDKKRRVAVDTAETPTPTGLSSKALVFKQCGLSPPRDCDVVGRSPSVRSVSSTSDEVDQVPIRPRQLPGASASSSNSYMYFVDNAIGVMKRRDSPGNVVLAKMMPGPEGFKTAQFPDEGETLHDTIVPNLFGIVLKRPAAIMKKPAAVTEPQTPTTELDEDEEEEHEEEEHEDAGSDLPMLLAPPEQHAEPEYLGYVDKTGKHITDAMKKQYFPNGCSRCRHKKGCTRSCWAKRRCPE